MPGACGSKPTTATPSASGLPDAPAPATASPHEHTPEEPQQPAPATMAAPTKRVFIVYYSMYGHIEALARAVKKGVDEVEGVQGVLYQVAETLPDEVLAKMHTPPKASDVPVINPRDLPQADGFVFGFPTRFGMMCAQMKAMFDATGSLWQSGALFGKAASLFTSTASQGSGQETTILTAITQLAHHGMVYVPTGYGAGPSMFDLSAVKGGSPWGAGTLADGNGSRKPSEAELAHAVFQGKNLAGVVKKLTA